MVSSMIEPVDERIRVAAGIELRVLRWQPPLDSGTVAASGAPFLLVHGLASNARLWDGVARRLASAGHSAVAVDLRGHGRSPRPRSVAATPSTRTHRARPVQSGPMAKPQTSSPRPTRPGEWPPNMAT